MKVAEIFTNLNANANRRMSFISGINIDEERCIINSKRPKKFTIVKMDAKEELINT